jgi:DNA modification methylase
MLTVLQGDALSRLRELPAESVQCCVTSPPYWGLRDYASDGQLGLEKTPEEYVAKMVEVFREVRRVLRNDGTLWLNLGDSYFRRPPNETFPEKNAGLSANRGTATARNGRCIPEGLKEKDLVGIPWRVAFALQADGWWLRQDIIWNKPNPMPESVTDRCTKSHEYLFLFTKSSRYFYDAEAIKERQAETSGGFQSRGRRGENSHGNGEETARLQMPVGTYDGNRNKRSVWTVATAPYPEAHFATYPPDLIKPCIMAGTSAKGCCAKCGAPWERIVEALGPTNPNKHDRSDAAMDVPGNPMYRAGTANQGLREAQMGSAWNHKTLGWQQTCECKIQGKNSLSHLFIPPASVHCTVLDPFAGSGTTGQVALELGRSAILIELNPKYIDLIKVRCDVTPGLALA